ncbi:MAG: IPT/TIG domain-containing protein [Candidatus Sericytochromatia bacterium]|nr:IPT/TIG domain-containing protein [Candidatus Tanganyikabacteria bacterium]
MGRRKIVSVFRLAGVLGLVGMTACAPPDSPGGLASSALPPIEGAVTFGATEPAGRQVAAKFSEVGNGATVSFIDPDSGNTVTTTLTTPDGKFRLTFLSGNFSPGTGTYFLEAVKGLSVGGAANRVGAPAARVRTLIAFVAGDWSTLTAGSIAINRSTTVVAALSNLKGLTQDQNRGLLGRIVAGKESTLGGLTANDTFSPTAEISAVEFHRTWDLVAEALRQDADPIGSLFLRPADGTSSAQVEIGPGFGKREGVAWAADGFMLAGLSPADAAPGDRVTVYGHGLPTATDSATVWLGGKNCPVVSTDGKGSSLQFLVAAGAVTGNVEFRYGPWINRSLFLVVR